MEDLKKRAKGKVTTRSSTSLVVEALREIRTMMNSSPTFQSKEFNNSKNKLDTILEKLY